MTPVALLMFSQVGAAPPVPWVVFIWVVGGIIASAGAFYSTKYAIRHEVDDVRTAVTLVNGKMDAAKKDLEAQIKRRSRVNKHVRIELAALREDMEARHTENVDRGKFTLKLVAEMARQMGVDGVDEKVLNHLIGDHDEH